MRVDRLLVSLLVLAALLTAGGISPVHAERTPERPNVLLIMADDMGYSDIAPFGGEIRTPTLDSLAQVGLRMTNFYVGPACSPTRSMLLSGNDNHVAGMGTNAEVIAPHQAGKPGYEGYFNDRVVSFASLLRDSGYHTYMAGKWHLGEEPEHDPSRHGFERSYTMLQGGASHFDDEWMMCANYTPIYRKNGVRVHVPRGFYSTEFYTKRIIDYIETQKDDKPFFAYLSLTAPHDPLHAPDDWLDRYQGAYEEGYNAVRDQRLQRMVKLGIVPKGTELGPWLPMIPKWDDLDREQKKQEARRMEIYAAMIENIDFHIGRLLAFLKEAGHYDNTLILFFSDNGANGAEMHLYPDTDEAWVERNSDNRFSNWGRRGSRIAEGPGWAQASSTPFRLFKGFIAEGGIRSPMIISGPGVAGKGTINHAMAHVMDLAPTFLELAGVSYPESYQGRQVEPLRGSSMARLLDGRSDFVHADKESIGWEMMGWRAIRRGDWKVTWIDSPFGESDWQLFDLATDPGETRNLAAHHPEILGKLLEHWEKYEKEVGVILPRTGFIPNL